MYDMGSMIAIIVGEVAAGLSPSPVPLSSTITPSPSSSCYSVCESALLDVTEYNFLYRCL